MSVTIFEKGTSLDTDQPDAQSSRRPHRLLLRGESAVAFIGIALAAILIATVAAGVWWTLRTETQSLRKQRAMEIQTIGSLLAPAAEALLAGEELSTLRTMVANATTKHELSRCRIVMPDGQIVADADPSKITLQKLPAKWAGSGNDAVSATLTERDATAIYPLHIAHRGTATLELAGLIEYPIWLQSQAQTGLTIIGAASLMAVLLVYRTTRSRLRSLSAIRESLLAMQGGEDNENALSLNPNYGKEASAWNRLLADRTELRRQALLEKTRETLVGRGGADLRGACDAISQGLILVDERLTVRYANGAAATFLRAKRELIVGGGAAQFLTDPKIVAALTEAATGSTRRRSTIEVETQTDEGKGILRYHVRPVRKDDAAAAMILIEDVTQQRVADEARNQFVAQATHELRTPLTNIRLYVETALEEGENDPALRAKALNVINQESARLERIVDDMLKVAEMEAGSLKLAADDVHLNTILSELLNDYEAQAQEKSIALAFNLAPKLPIIQADRDKLTLAMHNLVGNALKYTPNGGRVAVNVDVADGKLVFEVRDTGIGISPEDQQKIFEKFYRAQDRRVDTIVGTGLGLAIARDMIRLHGGDITVESSIDKGSTFTLSIPTHVEAA